MARRTGVSTFCMAWLIALALGASPAGAGQGCYPPPCAGPAATSAGVPASGDLPATPVAAGSAGTPTFPVVAVAFGMLAGTLTVLCARRRADVVARNTMARPSALLLLGPAPESAEPERSLR